MRNHEGRYVVVYPGGITQPFQTLKEARRECNSFERGQWWNGQIALIYDNVKKVYIE